MTSSNRLFLLTLCPLLGLAGPAAAATLTVNDTCSLIQAIQAAESNSPVGGCAAGNGADGIVLTADVVLDVPLLDRTGPTGLPVITSTIRIDGNGHTIRRAENAPRFRLLYIDGGDLALEDLILANGSLDGADGEPGADGADGTPGGPGADGGDAEDGQPGNNGEPGGHGAGIYVESGKLLIRRARISNHSARGGNGGRGGNAGRGGNGERAGNGGWGGRGGDARPGGEGVGVFNHGGEVEIIDSVFTGNTAIGGRGGNGGDGGDGGDSLREPPDGIVSPDQLYGYGGGGGFPGEAGRGGNGSALYNNGGGQMRLVRTTVIDNDASGGAVTDNAGTSQGQRGSRAPVPFIITGTTGATGLAAPGGHGAVHNRGTMTMIDSLLQENRGHGSDGNPGFTAHGGGPRARSTSGNTGGAGGIGGLVNLGTLSVSGTTFLANRANGGAGGGSNGDGGSGGVGALGAFCSPGYLVCLPPTSMAAITVINSTFSSNRADGGSSNGSLGGDGGIGALSGHFNDVAAHHLSVVANSARGGTGDSGTGETGTIMSIQPYPDQGNITIANSLFAANEATLCDEGLDLAGQNLADAADCAGIPAGLTGVDLMLAEHGGPTPTHALLPDSSARDAADPTLCDETGGIDQRGWERDPLITGACDIGAFEYNPVRLFQHDFE